MVHMGSSSCPQSQQASAAPQVVPVWVARALKLQHFIVCRVSHCQGQLHWSARVPTATSVGAASAVSARLLVWRTTGCGSRLLTPAGGPGATEKAVTWPIQQLRPHHAFLYSYGDAEHSEATALVLFATS